MSVFGESVRSHRQARGWTQAELAGALSGMGHPMHQTSLSKMESGTRTTLLYEALLIAEIFDTTVEDMARGESVPRATRFVAMPTIRALNKAAAAIADALAELEQNACRR